MATENAEVIYSCLEDYLLFPPQHKDFSRLALIRSPYFLQQSSLLCKSFLWCLQTYEGGSSYITGTNNVVQFSDVCRDD